MFGIGKGASGRIAAVIEIESASAGVAIFEIGKEPKLIASAREELPLEGRTKTALASGISQLLAQAGQKALSELAKKYPGGKIGTCYCILGSPWTHSIAAVAHSVYEKPVPVTDAIISDLAKKALTEQKGVDASSLLEANVVRVLLNGYPTGEPAGKKAVAIDLYTLASDCDPEAKRAIGEGVAALFPDANVVWRSSARAILSAAKMIEKAETCLVVDMSMESTDLLSVRKGIVDTRTPIELGAREILQKLAKTKPPQETMSTLAMLEKEQCETESCEALRQSIAKAEPELVHIFGEGFAKLSTQRKLPEDLFLIAPAALLPWLSRFFTRIDFTQFTSTTRPFTVSVFSDAFSQANRTTGLIQMDDPALALACDLVNMELSS